MSKEGWNWLYGVKKEHYFREGRSLCRRWLCLGGNSLSLTPPSDPKLVCQGCLKRLNKERSQSK